MRNWLGILLVSLGIASGVSVASAATERSLTVDSSAAVTYDGTEVVNALRLSPDQQTILVNLADPKAVSAGSVTARLRLPVTMPAEWRPQLIANRCACPTRVERLNGEEYLLTASGLVQGADVILRADFPQNTFTLSGAQRAALDIGKASPWLLVLASLVLLGSLGFLGWMMREMAEFRSFKFSATPTSEVPNDLRPAMVSMIPSGKITAATIAALLVDLSRRGYLTWINKQDESFAIAEDRSLDLTGPGFALGSEPGENIPEEERVKAEREGVSLAEKFLLAKLFVQGEPTVTKEELKQRLGRHLSSAKMGKVYAELYQEATNKGYFIRNPHDIHLRYRGVGIAIFFAGLLGFGGSFLLEGQPFYVPLIWAVVALAGYIVTRMVPYLPLLTVTGQAELVRWAGFRAYLTDTVPLDATVPTQQFFDYLPYAVAWDVVPAWSRRFGDRSATAPTWYLVEPREQSVREFGQDLDHMTGFVAALLAAVHEHTVR